MATGLEQLHAYARPHDAEAFAQLLAPYGERHAQAYQRWLDLIAQAQAAQLP